MKRDIPFPPYLPDQSVNSGVSRVATNVYVAADGYRPVGALSTLSDALDETFLGGASVKSTDGTAFLLAGTATDLYKFGNGAWTSLVSSLTVADRWKFQQFGDYVVCVNGSVTREVNLSAGTDSVLTGAPTGTCVALIGDFVVIGQADGDILRIEWSAFNDHTGWTAGTDQSGFQPMLDGGEIMGLAGGEYGLIFQRNRIVRMTRTGDPDAPFQFDEITTNFGCASKASMVTEGRTTFWLSDRGFMAIEDGQSLRAIGSEKVDRTFARTISRDDYERIWSAIDPVNKLVMWGVPGLPGRIWCYNWELDRWATIEVRFNALFAGFSSSLTLEEVSALFSDLDAMTYSLDDPRFSGGEPKLYVITADDELATFSGENLEAKMGIGFTEFVKGRVAGMTNVRPVGDAVDGVTIEIDSRYRLGDNGLLTSSDSLRASGTIPLRCSGRHMSTTQIIAAGTDWRYAQGIEFDFSRRGER